MPKIESATTMQRRSDRQCERVDDVVRMVLTGERRRNSRVRYRGCMSWGVRVIEHGGCGGGGGHCSGRVLTQRAR